MFSLSDVLLSTRGELAAGAAEGWFRGVSVDSRGVQPGDLFVACPGERQDGHEFVEHAFAQGAAGAMVERLVPQAPWGKPAWTGGPVVRCATSSQALVDLARYWRGRHDVRVIGVTGSVGKTTTKEIVSSLLAQRFPVLRSPSNLNTEIGLPLALMQLESEHRVAVLEMAMYDVGDIRHLASIARPEVGIVTNVHPIHLERLGSLDRIVEAKRELVEALPTSGLAILNADDPRVAGMAGSTQAAVLSYGTAPNADLRAEAITGHGLGGVEFTVVFGGRKARARMKTLGLPSVQAGLAAVAAAMHLRLSFEEAVEGLAATDQQLRLIAVEGIRGATILDDAYNASPPSMLAALDLLSQIEGRRVAVLGDMLELGAMEEEGHRAVGRRAAGVAHWLVAVGPRANVIAEEAQRAGMDPRSIERCETSAEAAARLREGLGGGDFVLVKGSRGMRLDRVVEALRAPRPSPTAVGEVR